jgi:hypothetical protein
LFAKLDLWILWRHQHLLNFLGKKFGVTKQVVVHSCLFWLGVAHLSILVETFNDLSLFWWLVINLCNLIFVGWLFIVCLAACESNDYAYKVYKRMEFIRIMWLLFLPLDVWLTVLKFRSGSFTLLEWGGCVDILLALISVYFACCVEPPPKERKEELKPAFSA